MPAKAQTRALVAEMEAPRHSDRAKAKKARKEFCTVLHERIAQANEYLKLYADMIEEETNDEVRAMSEEVRQTFVATREHAMDLDARVHRFRELDEQLDRVCARLKSKVTG